MVSAIVEGQEVQGRIHRRESDAILLEITAPYSGILADISLPKFIERETNLKGHYGDDCILFLLKQLLDVGDHTRNRLSYLIPHYLDLKADIDRLYHKPMADDVYRDKVFGKKTLFFFKHYPRLYTPPVSWRGILNMISNEIDGEGILYRFSYENLFDGHRHLGIRDNGQRIQNGSHNG